MFSFVRSSVLLTIGVASLTVGCSGGGGNPSPAPKPSDPYGGLGATPTFDQKANFTVVVPPKAALLAARRKAKVGQTSSARRLSAATTTNQYVSPNVASVSFQVANVDGVGLRNAPTATIANISCGTANGCSVPVQGVPASKGSDLFLIQTFSGPNGSGNLVSFNSIAVTVPSTQATSFGGTSLTVGGLVQSLSLAPVIAGGTFRFDAPASASLAVNAIDAAGAVVIGNDVLQNPIAVSFPSGESGAFAFASGQATTLPSPATVTFDYNGTPISQAVVNASTNDYAGNAISTSAAIPVTAAATPPPPPPPPGKNSIYVLDTQSDRIIEYAGLNTFEGGGNVTAQRVIDIVQPASTLSTISCPTLGTFQPIANAFAVRPDGSIYVQTTCFDIASGLNSYIFVYSPGAVDTVSPSGTGSPPVPNSVIQVAGAAFATASGIKVDETFNGGEIVVQYGSRITGFSLSNPATVKTDLGSVCIGYVGSGTSCDPNSTTNLFSTGALNFALDGTGGVLTGGGEPAPGPEPVSQQVPNGSAILRLAEGSVNANAVASAALSGYTSELAGTSLPPIVAVEGQSLYAVVESGGNPIQQPITGNQVYPGLSGCPPPKPPVAVPNTVADLCSNFTFSYLVGFRNIINPLVASGLTGQDDVVAPSFMIGGDIVGNFPQFIQTPGDALAVSNGFAFVINDTPFSASGAPVAPEIDAYETNPLVTFSTDVGPFAKIQFTTPAAAPNAGFAIMPGSIVIAPTSSTTGGVSLLARKARVHRDLKAYARYLQSRSKRGYRRRY